MATRTKLRTYLKTHGTRPTARKIMAPDGSVGRDPSWLHRLSTEAHRDIYVVTTRKGLYLEETRRV